MKSVPFKFTPDSARKIVGETKGAHLDLHSRSVSVAGVQALADVLAEAPHITGLNLYLNQLGAEGANEVKNMLIEGGGGRHLQVLNLRNNSMGVEGAKHIAEGIRSNRNLIQLNLDANGMGPKGIEAIADALRENTTLTSLGLAFNQCKDAGARALASALKSNRSLTALDVEGNNMKKASLELVEVSLSSSIRILNLSCNGISDSIGCRIAKTLLPCGKDFKNDLTAKLDEKSLAEQKGSTGVQELLLRGNRIHLKGMMALADIAEKIGLRIDLRYNTSGAEANRILYVLEILRHLPLHVLASTVMDYVPEIDYAGTRKI